MKIIFSLQHLREKLFAVMVIIGSFGESDITTIIFYIMALLLQVDALNNVSKTNSNGRNLFDKYVIVILDILMIMCVFFMKDTPLIRVLNRILPLIAIFGCFIIADSRNRFDIEYTIYKFAQYYTLLSIIIDFDAIRFLVTGNAYWKPITYLGFRFIGPIGDANYLALYSSTALLIILLGEKDKVWKRRLSMIVLLISIVLAGSTSSFILIPFVLVTHVIVKQRNLLLKTSAVFLIYIFFMILVSKYGDEIKNIGINILNLFYRDDYASSVKWESLQIRLDVQLEALRTFLNDIWGQGPRQLVEQLGHDTHNSFVSIMFEEGILGMALIFITLRVHKTRNCFIDIIGTYLLLSALLLDVHFTSLYLLLLLMQYYDKDYNKKFQQKILMKE